MPVSKSTQIASELRNDRGNILFLILIAVALFAALSFAISQSMRGGSGSGVSKEKTQMLVDQLSQYSAVLANAMTRVVLANSCGIDQVSFDSPRWADNAYSLPSAPVSGNCDIFGPTGGGVVWQTPPYEALAIPTSHYGITFNLSVNGVGTTEGEVSLVAEVTKAVCLRANEQDGAVNPAGEPPTHSGDPNARFETPLGNYKAFGYYQPNNFGSRFTTSPLVQLGGSEAPELAGHQMGCYYNPDADAYVFYQVMMPR